MDEFDVAKIIDVLVFEHDEHMKLAYSNFLAGEDPEAMWAYGAGLQHAIRRLQSYLDDE